MSMDLQDAAIHRTWVQLLVEYGYKDVASIAVDTDLFLKSAGSEEFRDEETGKKAWKAIVLASLMLPPSSFGLVKSDSSIRDTMQYILEEVLRDRELTFWQPSGYPGEGVDMEVTTDTFQFKFLVKLVEVEDDWRDKIRQLISGRGISNQAIVTEKAGTREGREILTYNEMKFGSKSEIRIAQELETRKILFFPLPLAIRAETGKHYQDHREVDFLICDSGVWGILEVAFHDSTRYEKDKEKDAWFKKSGILCVEHYPAERCYNNSKEVIDEFLSILRQYRR